MWVLFLVQIRKYSGNKTSKYKYKKGSVELIFASLLILLMQKKHQKIQRRLQLYLISMSITNSNRNTQKLFYYTPLLNKKNQNLISKSSFSI